MSYLDSEYPMENHIMQAYLLAALNLVVFITIRNDPVD